MNKLNLIILQILFALLFSLCASFLFLEMGEKCERVRPWLSLIVDVAPEWYMNTFYNSFYDYSGPIYKDLIFLDLSENATREDIANIMSLVAQYSPKVVGVDYTFPFSENYDSAKTEFLVNSINNLPEEIPFVFAYDTIKNAVPDSVMKKHHFGHVDFYGFYNFKAYDQGIPHMALAMAELAGYDCKKLDTSTFVVNYHARQEAGIPIHCPLEKKDSMRIAKLTPGRITLIGSTKNGNDVQKLPFRLNGKESYIAGSRIIRSMLVSILSTGAPKESPLSSSKYQYYAKLPEWINWSIVFVYALLYMISYGALANILKPLKKRSKWWVFPIGFIKSFISVLSIVLLLLCAMAITTCFHKVPNVVLFLYMTVFMSYFYELLDFHE